jgi:hypothetical protein
MTHNWGLLTGLIAMWLFLSPTPAAADMDPEPPKTFESPEIFGLELRAGPYEPKSAEGIIDDSGPMLGAELAIWAWRIPYVGLIGGSIYGGWGKFSGNADDQAGIETDEESSLDLLPLATMLVLRVDALPRQLGIPFVFTGKFGPEVAFWWASTGSRSDKSNFSPGLRWAAQVALELDFLEPRAARSLDEEWGINHTYLFFELYGSSAGKFKSTANPVGDAFTWAAGLGFIF